MQKKHMAFVPEGAKTQSGRDFRKEKGDYLKFDPSGS